jgi:hypothetical protein
MADDTNRRQFLTLASAGTALSLAGCAALQGDTEATADGQTDTTDPTTAQETPLTETASDSTDTGGEAETVTVAVQPDQQQLRQRQQKIQSELQAGNITRNEAQQQAQAAETDLRQQAVVSFRERATSAENLTITDAVDQFGILLVSGPATSLIGALSFASVSALLPEQSFQQAKAQAEQRTQSPTASN